MPNAFFAGGRSFYTASRTWHFLATRAQSASYRDVKSADRLRIYIDTSVLGGCFDPEFAT